jgi:hypothetical protein
VLKRVFMAKLEGRRCGFCTAGRPQRRRSSAHAHSAQPYGGPEAPSVLEAHGFAAFHGFTCQRLIHLAFVAPKTIRNRTVLFAIESLP